MENIHQKYISLITSNILCPDPFLGIPLVSIVLQDLVPSDC